MATDPDKVMAFVKEQLKKTPDIATTELFEKAKEVDEGVKQLSLRQFNARFPLQIKRQESLAKGGGRRGPSPSTGRRSGSRRRTSKDTTRREAMRDVLLQFAADLSDAEERRDLVRVLANVDKYVDGAMKAAGR
ncbi:MAG: hypothetical protein EA352_09385 [Gemmatimonadales bacterium]|nr:MAG: hypothetical protein EA352_09385 [Gemmatimonadales bacterium]